MEFSDALRYLRTELGLTQTELASALNVTYATVSRWELGKTYPTRSALSSVMAFAHSHFPSEHCVRQLSQAVENAKKEKLHASDGGIRAVERSSLAQLIDDASFPIYVCDMETDELLYVNKKARDFIGKGDEQLVGQKCYRCLMRRDSPCPFCRKEQLVADRFTGFDAFHPEENAFHRVQARRILWRGRKAHVRFMTNLSVAEGVVEALLKADYETITIIDAATGRPRPFRGEHLSAVVAAQEAAGNTVTGVERYLRTHCVDDDADRVIKETSLPYVKEQLEAKPVVTVAYSLNDNGAIKRKRVLFTYIDSARESILCAMQNLTETFRQSILQGERLAAAAQTLQEVGGLNVARYDLKSKTFYSNCDLTFRLGYGEVIENVPDAFISDGHVAPDSVDEFRAFYENLRKGRAGSMEVALEVAGDGFHWIRANGRLIEDENKEPFQAIIVFQDVEEQREQAAVYQKWRHSLENRSLEEYTLFRCNLSKGSSFDKVEGSLLKIRFDPSLTTFNQRTREYASRFVHLDDIDAYTALLNSENLLAGFYRGTRAASLDYREHIAGEDYRWLRLSVEIAPYPRSTDVEVFLMYERSDRAEKNDEALRARMDADPLTGVLNRRAFAERFSKLLAQRPQANHALVLVDIDGFKRINESYGHAVGDQALADIAGSLHSIVRQGDLLGRLGGDEFLLCLRDVSGQAAAERRAAQILAALRKAFSVDIRVTASLGIAFYPSDGKDFNALYRNVDRALFAAKDNGRDSYAFYGGSLSAKRNTDADAPPAKSARKRRALLAGGDAQTLSLLKATLGEDFAVEACPKDGNAVALLRRYGASLSLVLLRLGAPPADPFALLDRVRAVSDVDAVPIIALCEADEREAGLAALRHGANDFILAPIDPELLKIRAASAVSKAENERLRAQNAYLQSQSGDAFQFRAVYENTGTVVVEYDWETHAFVYDSSISEHLFGTYDDRSLWRIFLSDMVADVRDVKAMQELIISLASCETQSSGAIDVMLKTPSKAKHWFTMNAFKRVNERNLPSKIILTFLDVNENILASKKLRFLAEHDSLTGLYNRGSFVSLVRETVRAKPGGSYVLLCCNINDFRFINERFGREEGDKLLRYSAEKVLGYANAMNGFAGRLSNDVYAVLLPNNPGILERVAVLARGFYKEYPLKARITGRVGAYLISDPALSADAMLDCAATASDSIKGKFAAWLAVYDDSMNEKRLREKSVSDRMEAALSGGQFEVYLQPQFHHATGQIVGAEALARWIDPERGVVSPGEFIPVFEKNGFITRLDAYVWDKAAQYLKRWIALGRAPVPLSVNVSREDLADPALLDKLLHIVHKYDVPIYLFRLEITESLFAEDTRRLSAVVARLQGAGFVVEMDDFGSGYSSLNILKDVPVDVLKLDMKFLSGDDTLGRGGMIINAVLRMSRWLNIPVIAEGVEVKEQADFLLSVGCPTIQGFLYERPMPADAFEKLLLSNADAEPAPEAKVNTELDAPSFWNPLSADSQVFNRYIGPAAVLEYRNGECEIVRMNARFTRALRFADFGALRPCPEDAPALRAAVQGALASREGATVQARCLLGDGSLRPLRLTLRQIAKNADRALLFAMLEA